MEKKTFLLNKEYLERVIATQKQYVPKNRDEQLINHGLITGYELLVQVIDEGTLICKEEEMMEETLCVDFKKKSLDKNSTVWYETLVFDISRMLKYYTENEIYAHLEKEEDKYAPDTLHCAIREAKEEYCNGKKN